MLVDVTSMNHRKDMEENIFIVLTTKLSRDNKKHYCNDHARERAKLIERSLFNNCYQIDKENWLQNYTSIDVHQLVKAVEAKTTKCVITS
jgi:hypothetical protein